MTAKPETQPLALFEGYGIELEYMLVSRDTLDVLPACDALMRAAAGEAASDSISEIERGDIAWSNELALHVVELKTNGPAPQLQGLAAAFQSQLRDMHAMLKPLGGMLMPTAMHPWMDPLRDTKLWPHEYSAIYQTFDRMFDCRGHGWSNLQSTHINLPFANDTEFERLHSAIRTLLPLLPALAASSPVIDGKVGGALDTRLHQYRRNCERFPSITGKVIPEVVRSEADYERIILDPIRRDVAPFDTDNVLEPHWVNARGAIARFDRNSIEIRVLDIQEHPAADLAIAALVVAVARALTEGRLGDLASQQQLDSDVLLELLLRCATDGERARIDVGPYLACLGMRDAPIEAGAVWQTLCERHLEVADEWRSSLDTLFSQGTLARRILNSLDRAPDVPQVYEQLCECLAQGRPFRVA